eukprot:1152901-Pelagomonas_calceolata.AAC.22
MTLDVLGRCRMDGASMQSFLISCRALISIAALAPSCKILFGRDVGELLPWGALRIIDRIKNIFKLAHGEDVNAVDHLTGLEACQEIELLLGADRIRDTCLVCCRLKQVRVDRFSSLGSLEEGGAEWKLNALNSDCSEGMECSEARKNDKGAGMI